MNSSPVFDVGEAFRAFLDGVRRAQLTAPIAHVSVIVVPMNPLMQSREVEFYLANTGAKALSGSPTFAAAAVGDVCL